MTKIEIASGSCSACAIRSAAMNRGIAAQRRRRPLLSGREHVDRAIGADDLLRGGDEAIARAEDFIHARNRARAIGERGDGLRAAHSRDRVDAEPFRCSQQSGPGLRAGHDDFAHARFLRGDHRHQQRRDQRKSPAGKITADGFNGAHALASAYAGLDFYGPFLRLLAVSYGANIARGMIHRRREIRARRPCAALDNSARDTQTFPELSARRSNRFVHANSAASPRRRTSFDDPRGNTLGVAAARRGAKPEFSSPLHL